MAIRVYRVAVVGCPRAKISSEGLFEGVGKSCLCNRFVRPEAYVETHNSSLNSEQWLNEPVTNGDHFIYWGAATKHLADGTKARFQIVEQTELYDASDSEMHAHPSPQHYLTRASSVHFKSRTGGKTAVKYRSTGEAGVRRVRGPTRNTQLFPNEDFAEKSQGVFGYVCVFDPSLEGKQMENQLSFWSELIPLLVKRKRKIVIACVKCDTVDESKISFASAMANHVFKKPVPFVEVSARDSVNVEEVFFAIATTPKKNKLPRNGKKPVSGCLSFKNVVESRKGDLNRAKDSYRSLLQKCVTQFSTTWSEVLPVFERESSYRNVLELAGAEGEETVLKMFQLRLIEIKLIEAGKVHGTKASLSKGTSQSYQDYLSSAFKGHPDLGHESLYDYVYSPRSSVSEASPSIDEWLTEPSLPSSCRNTPDLQNSRTNIHLSDLALSETRPRSSTLQEPVSAQMQPEVFSSFTLPRAPTRSRTDPPPLPPRAIDLLASAPIKTLSQSHSFMEKIPEATTPQESRLSTSMDCLLAEGDQEKRLSELVAEPYLHPVEVAEMMSLKSTAPPPLPSPSPPKSVLSGEQTRSSSVFMSMRVRAKSRPALPTQATVDGSPLSQSATSTFKRGHQRSRSNPFVPDGLLTRPPQLPPRNTEAPPPILSRPAPNSTSSSVFSESILSPIETSLEFSIRSPLPPTPRKTTSDRSPGVLLRGKKPSFDEDTEGGKNASEGEGLEANRITSPSPPRQFLDDDDDDDQDDSANQYARIEDMRKDMQKYILMSSSATLPKTASTAGEGDAVDLGKRSQTLSRPGKESISSNNGSAPLLPWKRKWKKSPRNGPIIHSTTTSSLPTVTPSPSHGRKSRPLPPSPTKPRRTISNKSGSGNIYEAIDDLRRQGSSRKGDAWAPPVEPRLVGRYVEAVRRLFALSDVKERWLEILKEVLPEEDHSAVPTPFSVASVAAKESESDQSTPSPQPKVRHKSSFSTADNMIPIQQPNPITPSTPTLSPFHDAPQSASASPFRDTDTPQSQSVRASPFHVSRQPVRLSPFQSPDQRQFKKASSREDLIQILNQQLNTDSLSSDSDSDDATSSSEEEEDSDIEPPSPSVVQTTKFVPTDLDEALCERNVPCVDSEVPPPPNENGGVEIVSNVKPSMFLKKRSKRRNVEQVGECSRNLSDSGISNCLSQTFEDGFSAVQNNNAVAQQNNSESEC